MKAILAITCLCGLSMCQTLHDALPPSPFKVCPVRMLNPLNEGERRFVYVNLYSHQW